MKTRFMLSNKRSVDITVDDSDLGVVVTDAEYGKPVGEMAFRLIKGSRFEPEVLMLTSAFMDRSGSEYKRQGIGRRCLELVRETSGLEITAAEDDGQRRDDGSHLTGNAPAFVAKMREEGLIA